MSSPLAVEQIDEELRPLLKKFFLYSRRDLARMRASLIDGNMEEVARLGHASKGAGHGYGFHGLGDIGARIEIDANKERMTRVEELLMEFEIYLDTVQYEFV